MDGCSRERNTPPPIALHTGEHAASYTSSSGGMLDLISCSSPQCMPYVCVWDGESP